MKINHTERGTPVLDASDYEIIQGKDCYHYLSHADRIVTVGFIKKESLVKNARNILATDSALATCRERYTLMFGPENQKSEG